MDKLLEYFGGNEMAAQVWMSKYAAPGEETPDDMHRRMAREFSRVMSKTDPKFTEEFVFELLRDFKYIVPQGSIMASLGVEGKVASLSNCFRAGTKVLTFNGPKNIEDVEIGDIVLSHDGSTNPVVQLHKNPLSGRQVYRIKVYGSPILEVTEDHRMWSLTKEQIAWGEVVQENTIDKLRVGDYIAIPKMRGGVPLPSNIDILSLFEWPYTKGGYSYSYSESGDLVYLSTVYGDKLTTRRHNTPVKRLWEIDSDFSYFLGLWYGDGCVFSTTSGGGIRNRKKESAPIPKGITFTFNRKEEGLIDFVSTYGEKLTGVPAKKQYNEAQNTCQILFHSVFVGMVFQELFGRYHWGKSLHNMYYSAPKHEVEALLQGIIDSDGCVTSDGDVRVVLANVEFVRSLFLVARSHGIVVRYSELSNGTTARIDFPKNSYFVKRSGKSYEDDRVTGPRESSPTHFAIELGDTTLLKITGKEKIECLDDYVYTLGVGNVHSYAVEGLMAMNCFVVPSPSDSYGGIMLSDEQLVQLMKRRGGVGVDISSLRPRGVAVKNAAGTSTGAASFMERFSSSTREVAQCIEGTQRVLTKEGLVEIKDVSIGDFVWTRLGWIEVINKFHKRQEVFEMTTKRGYRLQCSADHKISVGNLDMRPLKDLRPGDHVNLILGETTNPSRVPLDKVDAPVMKNGKVHGQTFHINMPDTLNADFAYVIGFMYGDGYVAPTSVSLAIEHKRSSIKEKVVQIVSEVTGYSPTIRPGDGAVDKVNIGGIMLHAFLTRNGLAKDELAIPDKVWQSPSDVQLAFLSGLFDADGYNSGKKKGYAFGTVSKKLANDIQLMLLANGIVSRISVETDRGEKWQDLYTINVTGKHAQAALVELFVHSIKVAESPFVAKRDNVLTPFTASDKHIPHNKYPSISDSSQRMSHAAYTSYDGGIDEGLLFVDEIVSITKVGVRDTYDISLPYEHFFWCEGVYVKNSGRRGALMLTISINHPDSEEFVNMKQDRTKVTGANVSVMLTDDFMKKALNKEDFIQVWPCDSVLTPEEIEKVTAADYKELVPLDGKYAKKVNAGELYASIVFNAWDNAEPGQLFIDRLHDYSPDGVYDEYKTLTTNPCCFAESCKVMVPTRDGLKDLKEITKEDEVWLDGECEFAPTSGYFQVGVHPVYKVTFSNGESLTITENHKLGKFVSGGGFTLVELKDIAVGDKIREDAGPLVRSLETAFTTIQSIEYAGEEMVGCIEVPDYHYFTANWIISGNSEIGMGAYDACRLVAINLFSYVTDPFTENAYFNFTRFHEHCGYMQIMGDAIVDLELEHIDRILEHIEYSPEPYKIKYRELDLWRRVRDTAASGRRTGCGITALGDTLAALGLKYDSEAALEVVGEIMSTKFQAELTASTKLAEIYRPFSGWNYKMENDSEFFRMVKEEFPELWQYTSQYGRRNVSWSTIAPTGSLSILTQTSSGLEPMFMPYYTRRRKINPNDKFNRVDFVDQNGDKWMEYPVLEPKFKMWMEIQGVEDPSTLTKDQTQEWFEKSPWYGSCAGDIDWGRRVDMQAVCQRYISHSISSTINIPNNATQEDVESIYVRAWQKGLKGVTVYRDGCRTGVLVTDNQKQEFTQRSAPKRPKMLPADVYHTKSNGNDFTVFVGLMDGKPYEVFAKSSKEAKPGKGEIRKRGKSDYIFVQDGEEFDMFNQSLSDNHDVRWAITRLVSTSLRHGADIKFVAEQLRKSGGSITDYTSALARILSKYTVPEVVKESCQECGAESLIREEGCLKCKSCGWTKCG